MSSKVLEWYDNGKLKELSSYNYTGTEKVSNGEWLNYYESGQISSTNTYLNGKPIGLWIGHYENGKMKYKMEYENGVFKSYQEFDENGNLK